MKNLYSIWNEPGRIKHLEDSGIPQERLSAAFERLRHDAERSPANFRYVGTAPVEAGAAVEVGKHRDDDRSAARKRYVFQVVLRKLKNAPVKTDAQGRLMLPPRTMAMLSRKLSVLNPGASYAERRDQISDMIKAGRSVMRAAQSPERKNSRESEQLTDAGG